MSLSIFLVTAAFYLLLVCVTLASPVQFLKTTNITKSPAIISGSDFRISQIQNPAFTGAVASGPAAYVKSLLKYNLSLPSDLTRVLHAIRYGEDAENSHGMVTATPLYYDREYLCPVQIGTPPQTLNLDFDTGSSDLWVFSIETSPSQTSSQVLYDPDQSSTSTLLENATWSITYADGSNSRGSVYIDTVTLGTLTVPLQAVESAQNVSSAFTSNALSSGLLGLGFPTLNTISNTPSNPQNQRFQKKNTLLTTFLHLLPLPLFTANLRHSRPGTYNFGAIDPSEYVGNITYTPIISSRGYWQFACSGFGFGHGNTSFDYTPLDAIADTGTTLLLLPSVIVQSYYKLVPNATYVKSQSGYVFPCAAVLPDFLFGIGRNFRGVVPGRFLNFAPVDAGNVSCYGGIQSLAQDNGLGVGAIFGDVVLKALFVVFDVGERMVGWARKEVEV